jgi:hypothetical protein
MFVVCLNFQVFSDNKLLHFKTSFQTKLLNLTTCYGNTDFGVCQSLKLGWARQYKRLSRACLFYTFKFVFLAATFSSSILILAKE